MWARRLHRTPATICLRTPLPASSSGLPANSGEQPSDIRAGTASPPDPSWPCSRWGLPSRTGRPARWWSLTPPFHPYPHPDTEASGPLAVCLCGTVPRVTPGGCCPPPCSVESGPSSSGSLSLPTRPPDRLIRVPKRTGLAAIAGTDSWSPIGCQASRASPGPSIAVATALTNSPEVSPRRCASCRIAVWAIVRSPGRSIRQTPASRLKVNRNGVGAPRKICCARATSARTVTSPRSLSSTPCSLIRPGSASEPADRRSSAGFGARRIATGVRSQLQAT